jgi:hypothetical protein
MSGQKSKPFFLAILAMIPFQSPISHGDALQ